MLAGARPRPAFALGFPGPVGRFPRVFVRFAPESAFLARDPGTGPRKKVEKIFTKLLIYCVTGLILSGAGVLRGKCPTTASRGQLVIWVVQTFLTSVGRVHEEISLRSRGAHGVLYISDGKPS
jgi:hypothetical protein